MKSKSSQESTLHQLLQKASATRIGEKYGFRDINKYSTFRDTVPFHLYDDIVTDIEEMKKGQPNVLWPGQISKFAVSAGTTGKGKHLPLSQDRLTSDKRFMRDIALSYFKQRPNPLRLIGKHLSLPGTVQTHGIAQIGEVSGFSALGSPLWLRPFQLVNPATLTKMNFQEKFDLLLNEALDANIKVITAVPSWILTLFQQAINKTGKRTVSEIWSNLNLLICGGVKLANYHPHLKKLIGDRDPDFIETYGASEGYFAFTDELTRHDLKLTIDNGIFYEFIKDPKPGNDELLKQEAVPIWEVETGRPYAMVVSTNAGLWRYMIRDIVEFTSTEPPRIVVKGRISEMLDDFGEALYIYEAEDALSEALRELNLQKNTFAIIPQLPSESDVPRHHWLIKFIDRVNTDDMKTLANKIDHKLQDINRHYATRREGEAIAAPKVSRITQQQINRWMKACNKTGAQSKFPQVIRENSELLL